MANLKFWNGAAWEVVQFPNIYAANGVWQARATSSVVNTTTTPTPVPGCSLTVPVVSTSERLLVVATVDSQNGSTTQATMTCSLYLDGVGQSGQVTYNGGTVVSTRATAGQQWVVTGLTPGNHTFDLRTALSAAAGSVNAVLTHTQITVVSLGPPPSPPGPSLPKPPMCKISANANQSTTSGTGATVVFSVTDYDTAPGLGFSPMADLANNQIIIPKAGYYRLYTRVVYTNNATGYRAVLVRANAVNIVDSYIAANSGSVTIPQFNSEPLLLAAGDAISVVAFQGSGVALNLIIGNGRWSNLAVEYVCDP